MMYTSGMNVERDDDSGDEFEEEDETALELRSSRAAARSGTGQWTDPKRQPAAAKADGGAAGRPRKGTPEAHAPMHGADVDDGEATELAERRSPGVLPERSPSKAAPPAGAGRAVPLSGQASVEPAQGRRPIVSAGLKGNAGADEDEATEWALARRSPALPQRSSRPAPAAPATPDSDDEATQLAPRPAAGESPLRTARATIPLTPRRPIGRFHNEASNTMPAQALGGSSLDNTAPAVSGRGRNRRAVMADAPSAPAPDDQRAGSPKDAADDECEFIVSAPDGAVIFVDGRVRGRGPQVRVKGISRTATVNVRIEAPGHHPWTGTVELEGRAHARIRPTLKKRET